MKAAAARTIHRVDFSNRPAARRDPAPEGRVPRVVLQLALAHRIDAMIRAGELRDLADAARALGVSRARVSQIVNLLMLAPEIQEAILDLPMVTTGRDPISERALRQIVADPDWQRQRELWSEVRS